MEVFITVFSIVVAIISIKMNDVVVLLKILFSAIIAYYLTIVFFPNFEIVDFNKWTWTIVISTFKMNEFWVGFVIMILIYSFFYWFIPMFLFLKIDKKIKPFFVDKIKGISVFSKNKSLLRLRKIYSFLFKMRLINYNDIEQEIKYQDYSKSIVGLFSIIFQVFILILLFDLSLLHTVFSLFFLLILFISIIVSPVYLYISPFIFKLYRDEYHRNNEQIS